MKFKVNVDIGIELDGVRFALGQVCELDPKDGRVQELVESGRLIPVEESKPETKKPDPKPEAKN